MNDLRKTMLYAAIALGLLGAALVTAPRMPSAAVFNDQGEMLFPEFKDPTKVTLLEVTDFNEADGQKREFKVVLEGGKWVIPSKFNHPADVKDQVARAAAAMVDLRKDVVRSDQLADHEAFGVVDPTAAAKDAKGQGTRIRVADAQGITRADYIFGKPVKDKPDFRFVRLPGQKRVYETKVSYEVSSKFSDWVDADLLQVGAPQIQSINVERYAFDEFSGRIKDNEEYTLAKEENGTWKLDGIQLGEELLTDIVGQVSGALDDLRIVDVRRKPAGLVKWARGESQRVTHEEMSNLAEMGFYVLQGRMLANDGEIEVRCSDGVVYRLFFGGEMNQSDEGKDKSKDSHYLLIRTFFNEKVFPEIAPPKETKDDGTAKTDDEKKKDQEGFDRKKKERDSKVDEGRKREKALSGRFAEWYYVIPGAQFKNLSKKRSELVKGKPEEPKKEEPKKEGPKKEEPKKEGPKKEEPKKEEPKKEEPKKEEPKKEEPKKEAPPKRP